jgi:methionyl aminopeptidase
LRSLCSPQLAREVLDIAAAAIRPGITTDAIDAIVHEATVARNAYPSPLNYRNFPKSVCTCVFGIVIGYVLISTNFVFFSSVNEVICHGIPDHRKLQEGDIVNLGRTSVAQSSSQSTHVKIQISDVTLYYDGSFSKYCFVILVLMAFLWN